MGSSDIDSLAAFDEKPQHRVYLAEYWIGSTEVTVSQFRAFVEATGYSADSAALPSDRDDHPVTSVSWDDAVAFCKWVSQVTGRAVRLPTEAEWEKASRGTDGRLYPWGNELADSTRANFNHVEDEGDSTSVGNYPRGASPYGAMDMAGNVWEWVNDWYQEYYYADSPYLNPPGPSSGNGRVLHSGSWNDSQGGVRAAARGGISPDRRLENAGFRCALSL